MKTKVVPAEELDPAVGLRAEDYVGSISKAKYVALEVKCKKLREEVKNLRKQRCALRRALRHTLKMIDDILKATKP